ncbi:MAG: hypothetical protein HY905_08275 [Deltaproteobacteria bacterium]|nr:hypothetical protein [Deltaproteobacteria bacterium]
MSATRPNRCSNPLLRCRTLGLLALAATLGGCPATGHGVIAGAGGGGPAPVPSTTIEVGRDAVVRGDDGFSEVFLTVMPDNLALVRERRAADLPEGVSAVAYADVVDTVMPESTRVKFTPDGGSPQDVSFLEQRYRYDLIAPARLLELSLGSSIHVRWTQPNTGAEKVLDGVIESTEGGLFLRTPDGTYTIGAPPGGGAYTRTVLDSLPGALFSRPQLDWLVDVYDGGPGVLETSYLASGFTWEADYVVTATEDFEHADLIGWVTLRNQTGARFDDAHLAVIAGDIHMASPPMEAAEREMDYDRVMDMPSGGSPGYVEEGLFEYHLYKLPRPTTVPAYSWKQVTFIERDQIPVTTKYRAMVTLPDAAYGNPTGTDDFTPAGVRRVLTIENQEQLDGLGVPLPAGTARVYARSGEDLFFIDSTAVLDTPREEPLDLDAGGAPFLVVKSKLTDSQESDAGGFGSYSVTHHLVSMVNRGSRTVTLVLRLALPGAAYPGYGANWDARLERERGGSGPALEEISSGLWEVELELAPDVETTEEFILRVRRTY